MEILCESQKLQQLGQYWLKDLQQHILEGISTNSIRKFTFITLYGSESISPPNQEC